MFDLSSLRIGVAGFPGATAERALAALVGCGIAGEDVVAIAEDGSDQAGVGARACLDLEAALRTVEVVVVAAGTDIGLERAREIAAGGVAVVDAADTWMPADDVLLVVPAVNEHEIPEGAGLIACPHARAGQLAEVLAVLSRCGQLKRVLVSSRAVIAAGTEALRGVVEPITGEGGTPALVEQQMTEGVPRVLGSAIKVGAEVVAIPGPLVGIAQDLHVEASEPLSVSRARDLVESQEAIVLAAEDELVAALASAGDRRIRLTRLMADPSLEGGLKLTAIGPPPDLWRAAATARLVSQILDRSR